MGTVEPSFELDSFAKDNYNGRDVWGQSQVEGIQVNCMKIEYKGTVIVGFGGKQEHRAQATKLCLAVALILTCEKKALGNTNNSVQQLIEQARRLRRSL